MDKIKDLTVKEEMSVFERYLTLWVALCIVAGVLIGEYLPAIPLNLQLLLR